MNLPTSKRRGVIASVVFLTITSGSALAQNPESSQPRHRDLSAQTPKQSDQKGMTEIANAYRQLHDATLSTLRAQTRNFDTINGKEGNDAERGSESPIKEDGAERSIQDRPTKAASTKLLGDELLIAAATEGLLAGAPSADPTSRMQGGAGSKMTEEATSSTTNRTVNRDGSENLVGMLLVCALPGNNGARSAMGRSGTDGEMDSSRGGAVDASTATTKLTAGTYAIKRSGNSIWLADRFGRVALRTTIDTDHGMTSRISPSPTDRSTGATGQDKTNPDRARDGSEDRATQRQDETKLSRTMNGNSDDWEVVFGAITKEAMTSMGWATDQTDSSKNAKKG